MDYEGRHFPNKLRKYRILSGYSQKDVAWILGHRTTSRLCRWERGLAKPSIDNLLKLSVLYGTLMEELCSNGFRESKAEVRERINKLKEQKNMKT